MLLRALPPEAVQSLKSDAAREAVRRLSFPSFSEWLSWVTPQYDWRPVHIRRIIEELEGVTEGHVRRLMIFMPPRHGKSETVTVHYPAWRISRDARTRVIVGCYGQDLARAFSRASRRKVQVRLVKEQEQEWQTELGGGLLAVGVGSGVTGRGADLVIIDDPVKSKAEARSQAYRDRVWDWYRNDLFTRLEPNGAVILIMTRWHEDDLAGRILASDDGGNWRVLSLPAVAEEGDLLGREPGEPLWPERYDREALSEIELIEGLDWYALYQQRPTAETGEIFRREWWVECYVDRMPERYVAAGVYFDTAYGEKETNDYTAAVLGMRGVDGHIYLMPLLRERMEFPKLVDRVRTVRRRWGLRVCVEKRASGQSLIQALRIEGIPVIELNPGGRDKIARAHSVTEYFEAGMVHLVRCSLLAALEEELVSFPNAKHDDLVDAAVYALRDLARGKSGEMRVHRGKTPVPGALL